MTNCGPSRRRPHHAGRPVSETPSDTRGRDQHLAPQLLKSLGPATDGDDIRETTSPLPRSNTVPRAKAEIAILKRRMAVCSCSSRIYAKKRRKQATVALAAWRLRGLMRMRLSRSNGTPPQPITSSWILFSEAAARLKATTSRTVREDAAPSRSTLDPLLVCSDIRPRAPSSTISDRGFPCRPEAGAAGVAHMKRSEMRDRWISALRAYIRATRPAVRRMV
jgi:hypothetical protein